MEVATQKNTTVVETTDSQEHKLDWLLHDHKQISSRMKNLRTLMQNSYALVADLQMALSGMRWHLTKHYSAEEASELYTEFPSRFPRFSRALSSLKGEHSEILSALDTTELNIREAQKTLLASRDELLSTLERLRHHEQAETEIVHKAYTEDMGSPG